MSAIVLYDNPLSGNGYKVRLFLGILRLPYRMEVMDVHGRCDNHAEWFVELNPLRQIPVIRDGDVVIRDSQAILAYLALKHDPAWIGTTPHETAVVMEWLSYAAREVSIGLQMSRLYYFLGEDDSIDITHAGAEGRKVLALLDGVLSSRDWLALGRPTIADLAVFPYAGLAREGHLPLDDCPAVLRWIDRITALPGYVPMRGLPGYVPPGE